jgi:hypothetical protein
VARALVLTGNRFRSSRKRFPACPAAAVWGASRCGTFGGKQARSARSTGARHAATCARPQKPVPGAQQPVSGLLDRLPAVALDRGLSGVPCTGRGSGRRPACVRAVPALAGTGSRTTTARSARQKNPVPPPPQPDVPDWRNRFPHHHSQVCPPEETGSPATTTRSARQKKPVPGAQQPVPRCVARAPGASRAAAPQTPTNVASSEDAIRPDAGSSDGNRFLAAQASAGGSRRMRWSALASTASRV